MKTLLPLVSIKEDGYRVEVIKPDNRNEWIRLTKPITPFGGNALMVYDVDEVNEMHKEQEEDMAQSGEKENSM